MNWLALPKTNIFKVRLPLCRICFKNFRLDPFFVPRGVMLYRDHKIISVLGEVPPIDVVAELL